MSSGQTIDPGSNFFDLRDPVNFPDEFKSWLPKYLEANPPLLPISQISGFSAFLPILATVVPEGHVQSSTYIDPNISGPPGPALGVAANPNLALPDGRWIVLHGGSGTGNSGGAGFMGLSVNGSTPQDQDACETQVAGSHVSVARANIYVLKNGTNNNSIVAKFRSANAGDIDYRYRWVMAIRYANL